MGEGSEFGGGDRGRRVGISEENSKLQANPNETPKNSTQAKHTQRGTKALHLRKRATVMPDWTARSIAGKVTK